MGVCCVVLVGLPACFISAEGIAGREVDDGSIPVIFFRKGNQWLCSIGSPPEAQNLKGIQPHGRRFRVQKRVGGDIRKWSFDNLHEAIKKRDAIFA